MSAVRNSPEALRTFGTEVLLALGVPEDDARLVADSLVQADLWGHQSHGLLRLPWYAARLRSGAMAARTDPEVLSDTGPLVMLDGRDGIGQVLADRARALAVERARRFGVGVVGVRNSNHFGTAMYFTRRAAHDGCVAILTTNASPAMAPWGGREKVLGTNPWSIAAPGPDGRIVAVDIANTAVAEARSTWREPGRADPRDLGAQPRRGADDGRGRGDARRDPADGRPQGYAITFLMDVLSGALAGSGVGTDVRGPYEPEGSSRCGHLFLALDPAAFGDPAEYRGRVGRLVEQVKGVPLAQGLDEVFCPGEVEDRAEAATLAAGGMVLAEQSLADLHALATSSAWRSRPRWPADGRPPTRRSPDGASKADLVHRHLKEQIELGELAPGTPLSELSLVEQTGASRTPVREALRRLAAEGLVDLTPRLGARVSRVSLQSVRDLFDFRSMLEPAAIRQATEAAAADPDLRRSFAELRNEFLRIQRRVPSRAGPARSTRWPTASTGRSSARPVTSTSAGRSPSATAHRPAAQPLARGPAARRGLGGRAPGDLRGAARR